MMKGTPLDTTDLDKRRASQRAYHERNKAKRNASSRAYRLANLAKVQAKQQEYRDTHKEEQQARNQAYYAEHGDKLRANQRVYNRREKATISVKGKERRAKNLDKFKEKDRREYLKSREKRLDYQKQYRQDNPEQCRLSELGAKRKRPEVYKAKFHRRKAAERNVAVNDYAGKQWPIVLENWGYTCIYCPYFKPACLDCIAGTHDLTVDHYIAVTTGGNNTLSNIRPACLSCNARKGNKPAPG